MIAQESPIATAKCDANATGRVASEWGMEALPCLSRRGLRTFTDRSGLTRYFCGAPGHEANAKRRFGLADTCYFCGRGLSDGLYVRMDFGKAIGVRNVCDICEEKGS